MITYIYFGVYKTNLLCYCYSFVTKPYFICIQKWDVNFVVFENNENKTICWLRWSNKKIIIVLVLVLSVCMKKNFRFVFSFVINLFLYKKKKWIIRGGKRVVYSSYVLYVMWIKYKRTSCNLSKHIFDLKLTKRSISCLFSINNTSIIRI